MMDPRGSSKEPAPRNPFSPIFASRISSLLSDDLESTLRNIDKAVEYFERHAAILRQLPFGQPDERRARMENLARQLRAALADPSLAEDARLELLRVKAEEVRSAAMFAVAASSFLKDAELFASFAAEGQTAQFLDWLRRIAASRPTALSVLGVDDLKTLRAQGFLKDEEREGNAS